MQGEMFVDTMSAEDLPAQSLQEEELIPQEKMEQTLQKEMPAGEFLQKLQMALEENRLYGAHGISKLFSNQEFQKVCSAIR